MESDKTIPDKVSILGSNISVWDLDETVRELKRLAESGGRHYVCVSNVHTVVMGLEDGAYREVTNQAALATADGVPLIWASGMVGGPKIHGRASGPDILARILKDPDCQNLRHYFFGSTPEVLERLEARLREYAPEAKLAGFYAPPFRKNKSARAAIHEPLDATELEECARIDASQPHIVWIGLGAPKQEIWAYRSRPHLQAPVTVAVGAAFDFLAGYKKRAPLWMQKGGLEWAYRLIQEPRRLTSRYLKTNPVFVAEVLRQALRARGTRP